MLCSQCRRHGAGAGRVPGRQRTFMMASSLRLSVSVTRSIAPLKEITRGLSTASKMICTVRRYERFPVSAADVTFFYVPRHYGHDALSAEQGEVVADDAIHNLSQSTLTGANACPVLCCTAEPMPEQSDKRWAQAKMHCSRSRPTPRRAWLCRSRSAALHCPAWMPLLHRRTVRASLRVRIA